MELAVLSDTGSPKYFVKGVSARNNGRAKNNINVKDANIQEEDRFVRPILLVVSLLLDNNDSTSSPIG
jgi:hypothetical protein